jgi:hypothetical protein
MTTLRYIVLGCFISLSLILRSQEDKVSIPGQFILLMQQNEQPNSFLSEDKFSFKKLAEDPPLWKINYQGTLSDREMLDWLKSRGEILIAQYDHKLDWRQTTPNDSNYFRQWHLKNTGQIGTSPGSDMDAEMAWDSTTGGVTSMGDTIVIALIDSRVDLDHIDLDWHINRLEIPNNGVDDDSNGYVDDFYGWNTNDSAGNFTNIDVPQSFIDHGTHIAGIMGAIGNNGRGVAGVNWNVKVMPIVTSLSVIESEVVAAYAYAIKMKRDYLLSGGTKGAFIVASNSSFGVDGGIPANFPIWCALYDSLGSVGILNAGATTNSLVDVGSVGDIPSLCPSEHLIVVTNSDYNDVPVSSGYSKTFVDLAAPGTAVYSTKPDNSYGNKTGTSMASPNIAGAIALLYANFCPQMIQTSYQFPDSINLLVRDMILESTEPIDAYRGRTVTEGRINIGRAMQLSRNFNCGNCDFDPVFSVSEPPCAGESLGAISTNISSPPFSFDWSTGDTGSTVDALPAGFYWVKVNDTACGQRWAFFLGEPQELTLNSLNINPDSGSGTGSIAFQVIGGTGMIEYSIDSSSWQSLGVYQNLPAGNYSIYARDSLRCIWDSSLSITTVGINSSWEEGPFSVYPNPFNDFLILKNPEQDGLNIEIFNSLGQVLYSTQGAHDFSIRIPTDGFAQGIYLLRVTTESQTSRTTTIMCR